jgi:ornithine cyclodeaminase/alanine dehydrogenase-like protein (mu-crystallin family)
MDSIEITARRTAAATALAAKYLARPESRTLAMIGCGVQARYHVEALWDVLPIETVTFCDPRDEAADAFAALVRDQGMHPQRAADAKAAARGADLVVTVTTSTRPLLGLADIGPGTFVAGVGADNSSKHELGPDLLKASRMIVDSVPQAAKMGDLHHAIAAGVMQASEVQGDLAALVAGRMAGRANEDETWIFDSTGLSIQDLAAAEMIYVRARAVDGVPEIFLGN